MDKCLYRLEVLFFGTLCLSNIITLAQSTKFFKAMVESWKEEKIYCNICK